MESGVSDPSPKPQYWKFLSDADKTAYLELKREFHEASLRHNRNTRLETFDGILEAIRHFAERKDGHDWRRFLVCGVCWMDSAIAINTRQMRLLVSKCKSSINGCLQKMGYATNMAHSDAWKILCSHIPPLKDNSSELRQWTVRYREIAPPMPIIGQAQQNLREAGPRPAFPLKFRVKMEKGGLGVVGGPTNETGE
jgi:hypothetical protein